MSTSESRSYHHGDLRAALLAAARALLEEGGEAELTLRAAARRAGVSAMAPYRHFADKAALLAAVAAEGFAALAVVLAAADAEPDPREALAAQGVAYVGFACTHPALFRLMFGGRHGAAEPARAAPSGAAYRVLANRVAGLTDARSREDWTLAAWSLVHGLASLIVDGRLDVPPEAASRLTRLLTSGTLN